MCSHVPNKSEQMIRYYGYYSNVNRGKRKKLKDDESIPYILESEQSSKESRKNWAMLIQKIAACPGHRIKSGAGSLGAAVGAHLRDLAPTLRALRGEMIAVGMRIAAHPPHRSQRARLRHWALTLDG